MAESLWYRVAFLTEGVKSRDRDNFSAYARLSSVERTELFEPSFKEHKPDIAWFCVLINDEQEARRHLYNLARFYSRDFSLRKLENISSIEDLRKAWKEEANQYHTQQAENDRWFRESYAEGREVDVIDGPFKGFSGTIKKLDAEQQRLTVEVTIFGRKTPVELFPKQVELKS